MKKILLIVALLPIITLANAQNIRFGVKGGLNLSTISTQSDGNIDDKNLLPSFNAGVFVDLPMIGDFLSLQPGLFFTGKGSKVVYGSEDTNLTVKSNPYYIEGQANILAKIPFRSFKLYAGVGPYLAYGVAGNVKVSQTINGESEELESKAIKFTNDEQLISEIAGAYLVMKPLDFGFNLTAGLEFNNFLVSANYGHGLSTIRPGVKNEENITELYKDNKDKNRVFSVSIGIKF